MRLELGAGDRPTPGYVHQDIRELDDIEIVCDACDVHLHVGPSACDEIRATHMLEHLPYAETVGVLEQWRFALKPGGELYLEVPNLAWQASAYVSGEISDEELVHYVYGEQDHEHNFHMAGFTPGLLGKRLLQAGYVQVETGVVGPGLGQVVWARARRPGGV